jgi:thiamine biosynthesis lipoprotein
MSAVTTLPPPMTCGVSFRALGTYVELRVADPDLTDEVGALARDVLAEVDVTCSRFRADSDLSRANRRAGRWTAVSEVLIGMLRAALWAARETDGRVDPCLGDLLVAAGYDRTFARLRPSTDPARLPHRHDSDAWRRVEVEQGRIRVPKGCSLDLGAVGKGFAADLVALAILERYAVPAIVSVGGDVRVAEADGILPDDSRPAWPVRIAPDRASLDDPSVAADLWLTSGAVATSSVTARRWVRGGTEWHHVIDPRTARSTSGPWCSVSALAPSAAAANAYATVGLVLGAAALPWYAARGVPARLVGHAGEVVTTEAWSTWTDWESAC